MLFWKVFASGIDARRMGMVRNPGLAARGDISYLEALSPAQHHHVVVDILFQAVRWKCPVE